MAGAGTAASPVPTGMSADDYEELFLASLRVPLVLAIFLGLWGLVILVLQALQIDYSSVLRKASGACVLSFRLRVCGICLTHLIIGAILHRSFV